MSDAATETTGVRHRLLSNKKYVLLAMVVAYIAILPFISNNYILSIIVLANAFAIYAMAWDFLSGLSGYMNFGPSFFVGAGAYTVGILFIEFGVPLFVAIPAAFVLAVVAGLVFAYPSLRLRGFYFTLVTVLLPLLALKFTTIFSDISGGRLGLQGIPRLSLVEAYYVGFLLVALTFGALYWLAQSDFGLVLRSIKANELAVESAGLDTTMFKLGGFVISAFFTAVGGIFYAFYVGIVAPSTTFDLHISIEIIIGAFLGGVGTIYGPIGGAYIFIVLRELLAPLGNIRFVILFLLALLIVIVLPGGVTTYVWSKIKSFTGDADE